MGRIQRNKKSVEAMGSMSQPSTSRRNNKLMTSSQPSPSRETSNFQSQAKQRRTRNSESQHQSQNINESTSQVVSADTELQLVGSLVRYIFAMDKGKKPITKASIMKNVFGVRGTEFKRVMPRAKTYLSQIFGYRLVDLEGSKYILVNEIRNDPANFEFLEAEVSQLILLFLVLTQIFMQQDCCSEVVLWDYLEHLGILNADSDHHSYFGNVKKIISQDLVVQRYLDKMAINKEDPPSFEYKWGPRAEYEFTRRAALEYVSKIYNRAMHSWPVQYKTMLAKEKEEDD